jgi:hypothetical protein
MSVSRKSLTEGLRSWGTLQGRGRKKRFKGNCRGMGMSHTRRSGEKKYDLSY